MGLDYLELVLELEDEFGVTIPDEEAALIRSVGDCVELIVAKFHGEPFRPEVRARVAQRRFDRTRRAFYHLRRVLADASLTPRREVRPSTRLADLIPLTQRPYVWRDLHEARFHLPELGMTWFGYGVWLTTWVAVGILVTVVAGNLPGGFVVQYITQTGVICAWPLASYLVLLRLGRSGALPGVAGKFPKRVRHVGDLVERWWGDEPLDDSIVDERSPAAKREGVYRTARAFYRLRSELAALIGGDGIRLRRESRLDDVIPRTDRWRVWEAMQTIGAPLSPLRHSWPGRLLVYGATALVTGLCGVAILWWVRLTGASVLITMSAAGWAVALVATTTYVNLDGLLRFLARRGRFQFMCDVIPRECESLDAATRYLVSHSSFARDPDVVVDPVFIAQRVRRIVASIACADVDSVQIESRLFEDLEFS